MDLLNRSRVLKIDEPPSVGRVRFLSEADRSVIPTIHCGVLFVMLFWSCTWFQSFARLKQVLSRGALLWMGRTLEQLLAGNVRRDGKRFACARNRW
jgi:hypothetical protein